MKNFKIYKKRDGQSFKEVSEIYSATFEEAMKKFALKMTNDNHNKSNNIVWLDAKQDGVNETGWYDFNGGTATWNEDNEKYDADEVADFLLVSEENIKKGFNSWSEDVYTWEIRNSFSFEIYDEENELFDTMESSSLEELQNIYTSEDGYSIIEK